MDFASTFKFLSQASEFGCGVVLLGYFSPLFNALGIILIFGFCMRIMRSGWTSNDILHLLCEFGGIPRFPSGSKVETLESDPLKPSSRQANLVNKKGGDNLEDGPGEKDENVEDEVFDVMTLRKMVKAERQRFSAACAEIENERVAASSAAEETMAMILRLQNEKSSVEIKANQFKRMVEQKQEYDNEVIDSLTWNIAQYESQKSLLEDQLGIYREKLAQFKSKEEKEQVELVEEVEEVEEDDATEVFVNFTVEYDPDRCLEMIHRENL